MCDVKILSVMGALSWLLEMGGWVNERDGLDCDGWLGNRGHILHPSFANSRQSPILTSDHPGTPG